MSILNMPVIPNILNVESYLELKYNEKNVTNATINKTLQILLKELNDLKKEVNDIKEQLKDKDYQKVEEVEKKGWFY